MSKFGDNVEKTVDQYTEFFYKYSKDKFIKEKKLAKVQKADPPDVSPAMWFDKDDEAIEQLKKMTNKSTGQFYQASVQKAVHESVRKNMFESQLPQKEALEQMKSDLAKALKMKPGSLASEVVPTGFKGTADEYFKGLAEHTSSMARTTSTLYTMEQVEAETMVIRSLKTSRTCAGCLQMDGTTYKVEKAVKHVEDIMSADSLDEIRDIQPSFHFDTPDKPLSEAKSAQLKELKETKDSNVRLPAFHFRCECYVDMV
jgi:hypothetical protein